MLIRIWLFYQINSLDENGNPKLIQSEIKDPKTNYYSVEFYNDNNSAIITQSSSKKLGGIFIPTLFLYHKIDNDWLLKTSNIFNDKDLNSKVTIYKDKYMVLSKKRASEDYEFYNLYISFFKNKKWSIPKKIKGINFKNSNNSFPSFDEDGNLFFSSDYDNENSYGGYDFYMVPNFIDTYLSNKKIKPIILPDHINSEYDDLSIEKIYLKDSIEYYITSDRGGLVKASDLYPNQSGSSFNEGENYDPNEMIRTKKLFKITKAVKLNINIISNFKIMPEYDIVIYNSDGNAVYVNRSKGKNIDLKDIFPGNYHLTISYNGQVNNYNLDVYEGLNYFEINISPPHKNIKNRIKVKRSKIKEDTMNYDPNLKRHISFFDGYKDSINRIKNNTPPSPNNNIAYNNTTPNNKNYNYPNNNINYNNKAPNNKIYNYPNNNINYNNKAPNNKIYNYPNNSTTPYNYSNRDIKINYFKMEEEIFFKKNSAFIYTKNRLILNKLIHYIKSYYSKNRISVMILGYSSNGEKNKLSNIRAREIYYYFLSRGIKKSILSYKKTNTNSSKKVKIIIEII